MAYRKDQGRLARMATFWSLAVLLAYGCIRMRTELSGLFPDSMGKGIGGMTLPLVGMELSPALLLSIASFVIGLWFLNRTLEKPKNADLLIETEAELRKVTWPTLDETIDGSIVVMVVVIFLMVFMASADFILGEVFTRIITGQA
ncbi:preprotein translocase subunit SecE [Planctomycetes bacterium Poly30]|uniref:Protein translocase subunit SecE n=2 Tax=Saltatorellus ferox TaxID=2528018 RepID=A0A518EWH5_9BACT|nr:preprotein translocase subunit SecE [Planctomycetes bacterium Poly30]